MFNPNDKVDSFGKAQDFLIDHFNFFNGLVNPIFPAHCLVFESNPINTVSGDNIGDIVNINLGNILNNYFEFNQYENKRFKGYLLYVLIHELLHLDQDLEYYFKKYKTTEKATLKLENACHALTFATMKNYEYDLKVRDISYFYVPALSNFVNSRTLVKLEKNENIEGEFSQFVDKLISGYVHIIEPTRKVLWLIAYGLYGGNRYEEFFDMCDQYQNVIIEIIFNGKQYMQNYIKYLGSFVNWHLISDLYRLILYVVKQHKHKTKANNYPVEPIQLELVDYEEEWSTIKYVYNVNTLLDITYKFPNPVIL